MRRKQIGFTLIELVMVIVIVGVLAAVALPKFIDLSGDANRAAVDGVAGAMASASATNYAGKKANSSNGVSIANCDQIGFAMQGGIPGGYTVAASLVGPNASATCTVTQTKSGLTATFPIIGI